MQPTRAPKWLSLFLWLCLAGHSGVSGAPKSRDSCNTNYKFDYLLFSLQWTPGACTTSPHACLIEESRFFTIHGLWPTLGHSMGPHDCCYNNSFQPHLIDDLKPDLKRYWGSMWGSDDTASYRFWSHEWLKHGTCARDSPKLKGERSYFDTTLGLYKNLPIMAALKKANIVPNAKVEYSSDALLDALRGIAHNRSIQINCDKDLRHPSPFLTGINFCFTPDLQPTDCPPMKTRCRNKVVFLPHALKLR